MRNVKILPFTLFCLLTLWGCVDIKKKLNIVEQELLSLLDNDPNWVKDNKKINEESVYFRVSGKDMEYVVFVPYTNTEDLKQQVERANNVAKTEIVSILQNDIKTDFYNFKKDYMKSSKLLKEKNIIINQYIENFYSDFLYDLFEKTKITQKNIYQTSTNDIFILMMLKYNDFIDYVKQQQKVIEQSIKETMYNDDIKNKNIALLNNFIKQFINEDV